MPIVSCFTSHKPPNLGGFPPPQLKELWLELWKRERVGIRGEVPIRAPLGPDMMLFGEMIEKSWFDILLYCLDIPSPLTSFPIISLMFIPGGLFNVVLSFSEVPR